MRAQLVERPASRFDVHVVPVTAGAGLGKPRPVDLRDDRIAIEAGRELLAHAEVLKDLAARTAS